MIETKAIEASDLMLATRERRVFSREGWWFELKYDGFRCLVRKSHDRVDLVSRQGKLLNRSFPEIVDAVSAVPGSFVWDTELTVDEPDGRSSFERLQQRARTSVLTRVRAAALKDPARLYVFDMLANGKRDLRPLALGERKVHLRETFENTNRLVYVVGTADAGEWVFEQVKLHDFEGMVAKRSSAPYRAGRTRDWLKIKYEGYSRPAALGFGTARQL
ncbi:DNA ligase [Paraburkholderia sp. BR10872]|uniref:ATP-dependent DNA ligase n=1 Tax=Paraburkholderia sp. BR10872 TaxID=3236989 RepID=UPI0034D34424